MRDLLIAIANFLTIWLAGRFGILGLLTKFRERNGKITKWGRTAVIGMIVSIMVTVISQELDFRRQAKEQHEANEKLLKQNRSSVLRRGFCHDCRKTVSRFIAAPFGARFRLR